MSNNAPLGHVGEYGWDFIIDTAFDATGLSSASIEFKSPDGTKASKTATAVTTNAAGDFKWQVEEDFFTEGLWQAQLVLTFAGQVLKSDIRRFTIGPEINAS